MIFLAIIDFILAVILIWMFLNTKSRSLRFLLLLGALVEVLSGTLEMLHIVGVGHGF